jgi:hypothetical protein
MRPEEIRRRGVALAERVRVQVDPSERLEIMLRTHRRGRVASMAMATAAIVLAVVVGVFLLARVEEPPVITVPPTTVPSTGGELQSLPVEVFVVLDSAYNVDEATGACEGSGPLAGIGEGSAVHVFDEAVYESADDAPTITLPAGEEVTTDDPRSSFQLSRGDSAACVFTLPDLGYAVTDYDNISLFPESDPNVSSSMNVRGQRIVYTFGDSS